MDTTELPSANQGTIEIRKPKRILHCSDGIYEEYSEDEEDQKIRKIDPLNQSWPAKAVNSIVSALDYAGETLAELLNITTPKYSYEIEQFKKDQEARAKEAAIEIDNTWDVEKSPNSEPVTQVPKKSLEKY